MTNRSRRHPRRSRRRAALAILLLVPATAAVVVAYLARQHRTSTSPAMSAPAPTDCGPDLDSYTTEEFVGPPR